MKDDYQNDERLDIASLQRDVKALKKTLGTLISWMVSSSVSPIRVDESRDVVATVERAKRGGQP